MSFPTLRLQCTCNDKLCDNIMVFTAVGDGTVWAVIHNPVWPLQHCIRLNAENAKAIAKYLEEHTHA